MNSVYLSLARRRKMEQNKRKGLLNRENLMYIGIKYGWSISFDMNKNDFEEFETVTFSCFDGEDKISTRIMIASENETEESIDYQLRNAVHQFQRYLLNSDIKKLS